MFLKIKNTAKTKKLVTNKQVWFNQDFFSPKQEYQKHEINSQNVKTK